MKRFALFVGVNNYPENRLKYARADAEVLRKRFAEYYDETRLLVDEEATKETVIREMRALTRKASPGDLLLFFYSGHGHDGFYERVLDIPVFDDCGRYVPLFDSKGRFNRKGDGLHTNAIAGAMEKKGVHRLFILDCCRVDIRGGNAAGGGKGAGMNQPATSKAPTHLEWQDVSEIPPPAIISSSSPGQMSQELWGSDRHGLFTKALIETLDAEDVHGFNDFRKTIGDRMKQLKARLRRENPEDKFTQVASFEGSFDFDIPFWPPWEDAKPRRHRGGDTVAQESRRNESLWQSKPRRSRVATVSAVASAFEEADMLSRYFYLKSNFIPANKLAHACESMGVRCAPSRVLALYDDTYFGGSREGFVIAPEGIYAKNYGGAPMFFKWGSIDHLGYRSGIITINDSELCAADYYLSMEAKEAVYNGIKKVEEQISGEKFGNSDDDDESEDDDGADGNDGYESDGEDDEEEDGDGDEAEGDDDAEEDGEDGDSDDGDAWTTDPELLRQVNAALRKR